MPARSPLSVLAVVALVITAPAAGAAVGPTSEQIEEADDRVDELDRQIETAEDDLAEVTAELDTLEQELDAANAVLGTAVARAEEAEAAADLARSRARRTRDELAAAEDALVDNRASLQDVVRDAFMHGGQTASPELAAAQTLGDSRSLADLTDVLHFVEVAVGDRGLAVEETETLITRTDQLRRATAQAEQDRDQDAAEADAALDDAAARNAEVLDLMERADATVHEQQQLLAGLRGDRASAEQRAADLEQAARDAAAAADAAVTITELGNGLVRVGGITVAASLGPDLEDLLESARAEGIVLSGYGYRSEESTARLRRANGCPDVYDSPPSSCRVPTARPGESMHEQGLAIDFTYQGRTICYPRSAARCTNNAAFDWLSENAGRFGLRVLSSEAWHWSTNGQ